ncbi:MAG TPA: alanine--glyoxylate aminotransferase family protein [Pirellulales bacterium]|nr:alanine--glyoxylate aminotransferase family protein [Pirellulales bacterium]
MPKKRLMTPGPTQVPEEALLTLAKQVTHHRTPEFVKTLAEALDGLKYVFQTKNDVILLTSSGTGAMEAAVVNTVPRGGKAIVLNAGNFAERWAKICKAFGIEVIEHKVEWGQPVEASDVAALLKQHPDAVAVFGTLMESSTGVGHDVQAIGQVVAPTNALFVVDGISGAGVMECRTDAWGIDILVVGSQKALMLPPGLAFLSVSERAWKQIDKVQAQAFYFDLKVARKKVKDGPDTPWTPAHTLVAALAENLKLIRAEGIENIFAKAKVLSRVTRAGMEAIGLEVFAARPADGLTAVKIPESVNGSAFLKRLESRFGIKVAGGQGHIKGKIFRVAHMGIIDELDIIGTLTAIELVLDELGFPVELGSGVTAATRILAESSAAPAPA